MRKYSKLFTLLVGLVGVSTASAQRAVTPFGTPGGVQTVNHVVDFSNAIAPPPPPMKPQQQSSGIGSFFSNLFKSKSSPPSGVGPAVTPTQRINRGQ